MSPAGDVPTPSGTPLDLHLASGDLHAEWFGAERGRLVVCVPGLSANLRGFDFIAERIADPVHRIVTLDLRGRGRSQVTGPGTYGWVRHAEDVLDVADALGASRFDAIVPPAERDAFLAAVPSTRLVEVDANHYGINTHPASAEAIAGFLG